MVDPAQRTGEPERLNCFSLVSYIPEPLGRFLDEIRHNVEPNTQGLRAHVTVLPPRCLGANVSAGSVAAHIEKLLGELSAIEVSLGPIEIFPGTNVVYASVCGGFQRLREMHEHLNTGPVAVTEPFEYHPHVTLAQGLTREEAERVRQGAAQRWQEYLGPRRFVTESFTFVQANASNRWVDLAQYAMAPATR
jgi:2'-5' RNA ligase